MKSILIIDDDVEFCAMLRDYLAPHGLNLVVEHMGEAGLLTARGNSFDVILLDLMLPDLDGLDVLNRLREFSSQSVLVLSAQGNEANRIAGLDEGADDFLPKPFNPRELVSRIHAVLRRSERVAAQSSQPRQSSRSYGLTVNFGARQAYYRGVRLPLTEVELILLHTFLNSPGVVLHRENLIQTVFQRPYNPLDRSLDMHVSRLRKKLAAVEEFVDAIKTIRSSGYLFSPATLVR